MLNVHSISEMVGKEFMCGFASPLPFEVNVLLSGGSREFHAISLNVFRIDPDGPIQYFVSIAVILNENVLSVEIRDRLALLECDIYEIKTGPSIEEAITQTLRKFVKKEKK